MDQVPVALGNFVGGFVFTRAGASFDLPAEAGAFGCGH
jgi:hypothetical protein